MHNESNEFNNVTPKPLILEHQRAAYEKLIGVAKVCFSAVRKTLPVRLRTNCLIVGPSGSGKTFLAKAVQKELGTGSAFLSVSAADWILLGCRSRGSAVTWPMIVAFLLKNQKADGVVIFIDEIDKITGEESAWERFLRVEIYTLLDMKIPEGITSNSDDDGDCAVPLDLESAQEVLSNRTLIIAAGAFQHLWTERASPSLGFNSDQKNTAPPSLTDLKRTLAPELVLRFRSDLIVLPALTTRDYTAMLDSVAEKVPHYLRDTFRRLGLARIQEAERHQQGARFLEELMLDTILHERAMIKSFTEAHSNDGITIIEP